MRFEGLDLNLLVAFDALVSEGGVTAAAQRLNLTQSAMSAALRRLREYFDDDLIQFAGGELILTAQAESLVEPVRSLLFAVRSDITSRQTFDPRTSSRQFKISASDYMQMVLVRDVVRGIASEAPGITFELSLPPADTADALRVGGADLLIVPDQYLSESHPKEKLIHDDYVIIACTDNKAIGASLSVKAYLNLGHVVARIGAARTPMAEEWFLRQSEHKRRIEVIAPSFALVPYYVMGTERIATMHQLHARHFAKFLPIRILKSPLPIPGIDEMMQWHAVRDRDDGLSWLRSKFKDAVAKS